LAFWPFDGGTDEFAGVFGGAPSLRTGGRLSLNNDANPIPAQIAERGSLAKANLTTGRAWATRLAFQDIYKERSRERAGIILDQGYAGARRSRLEPMKSVAATLMRHAAGILAWVSTAASPMASSRASTASRRPPRAWPEATARSRTLWQ
jgi:hypothetical protein